MKKRPSIALLTALLAVVFAAGIGVYSSYIGMKIYQESSDHLLESFSQISTTFTLFVQRNWTVLGQWDGLLKNTDIDADAESIWPDMQDSKASWRYSDFYLVNEGSQYLTADGREGVADNLSGVIQELYSEGGPIVSTYTASYGVPKIVFAMPLSRDITLDGVTYTGLAVSYDTDVVDDLVDGSLYGGQSDCYIVRTNGDIVLALEPHTELCEGLTNLYDLDAHAEWKYGTMGDIKDCVQLGRSGSAQFICQGGRNYLVAMPTAFPNWSLVGIIDADEVDGPMRSVQQSTIIALGALCIFAVIIVVLALSMESQLRLRREEEERLSLEREKMQSDRLLQSMSRIVDRYSIVNLDTDRYRYRELRLSEPIYPTSGRYSDMVESISERYVALTETENAKLSRLLTPEYLRSVLRKPDDNLKIEYCSRTENAYMVLTIIPVAWHADGTVYEVMQVVQDIGQKVELENMANTDSMTGLFNERYFSRVLSICEAKKLPFVLYYLDLDRFKPATVTPWATGCSRRSRRGCCAASEAGTTPSASAAMSSRSSSAPTWTKNSAPAWPSASRPRSPHLSSSTGKSFRSASAAAAPAIRRTATLLRCASRRTAGCTRPSSAIMKTTGRRKRHEKQDPAPRRGDARPAADRGDGAAARRRTASARAGRVAHHPQHRLVSADGRRAARSHAPRRAPG